MPTRVFAQRTRRPIVQRAGVSTGTVAPAGPAEALSHPGIRRAVEYVHEHFRENVRLAEAARHARLSKYHFSRLFRELVGRTYQDYLTELRVWKAKVLLVEAPYRSVTSIGYEVGFGSLRNFEVHFKQALGVTPSQYRERSAHGGGAPPTSPQHSSHSPQHPACRLVGWMRDCQSKHAQRENPNGVRGPIRFPPPVGLHNVLFGHAEFAPNPWTGWVR